ncbi:MAG: hypothetical protein ING59_10350 [Burkholderiales bacterium]|nr:hypothetical protein [Burkholderiales bacterium]
MFQQALQQPRDTLTTLLAGDLERQRGSETGGGQPEINLKTAVDGRKTHQVAVATEQIERRSITGLELPRRRGNCPESRANTRSALFGSNDNCGF